MKTGRDHILIWMLGVLPAAGILVWFAAGLLLKWWSGK
jgi:hypothetical protein